MGAVGIAAGADLYAQYQATGKVTKKDLLDTFDSNKDGKIGDAQSTMGTKGVTEMDAAEANLGSGAADIVGLVNDPEIPNDANLIGDAYGEGDFDPIDSRSLFGEIGQSALGIPRE